jgi:hypothetical protein
MIQDGIGLAKVSKGEKREDVLKRIDLSILASYVKTINVDPDENTLEIIYQDGTLTRITSDRHTY